MFSCCARMFARVAWNEMHKGARMKSKFHLTLRIPNDVPTALTFVDVLEWREPEHALEILNRLTHEYPDHPGPFLRRAKMRRNQGEFQASAEEFAAARLCSDGLLELGDLGFTLR